MTRFEEKIRKLRKIRLNGERRLSGEMERKIYNMFAKTVTEYRTPKIIYN